MAITSDILGAYPIASGNVRVVYKMDKDKVVKTPKPRALHSDIKNLNEFNIYNSESLFNGNLAKVFGLEGSGRDSQLIMEKLYPLTKNKKIDLDKYLKQEGLVSKFTYDDIYKFAERHGLRTNELMLACNWGFDKLGNIKLLDYGTTYDYISSNIK